MVLKLIIISLFSLLIPKMNGDSLYEKNLKKTNKTIHKLWADEDVQLSPISLNPEVLAQNGLEPIEIYNLTTVTNELPEAYICFSKAPSKVDTFTFLVVYNLDLSIRHVEVLEYRENYGGEISSKRFLRQFQGKTAKDGLEIGEDIDGISGATISVKSIVHGVEQLNKRIAQLKNHGLI